MPISENGILFPAKSVL